MNIKQEHDDQAMADYFEDHRDQIFDDYIEWLRHNPAILEDLAYAWYVEKMAEVEPEYEKD